MQQSLQDRQDTKAAGHIVSFFKGAHFLCQHIGKLVAVSLSRLAAGTRVTSLPARTGVGAPPAASASCMARPTIP